jgi:hypothetical protein
MVGHNSHIFGTLYALSGNIAKHYILGMNLVLVLHPFKLETLCCEIMS